MVNDAKQVALNPRDQSNANRWRSTNNDLLTAVAGVRQAIAPDRMPDITTLRLNGK